MSMIKRQVTVHQVPSEISSSSQTALLRRLEMAVENGHPRFVLDCSKMENVGPSEMHFLLCCLEEAMKHNGDVRLAGLNPLAQANLSNAGVGRLFEVYDTTEKAVRSYQASPASSMPLSFETADTEAEYTRYAA